MDQIQAVITTSLTLAATFYLAKWAVGSARSQTHAQGLDKDRSRPPGPKPEWLLGNLRHFPKGRLAETFTEWQETYGDLIYMTVLGRSILVINGLDITQELTAKRIWSDRPHSTMIHDLMGWDWLITSLNPGKNHTEERKILAQYLGPTSLPQYDGILESELDGLLSKVNQFASESLAINPVEPVTHAIASIIIRLTYGDKVFNEIGGELIELNTRANRQLSRLAGQFWPVNYLPSLQYLPEWMPGVQFKRLAREGRELQERVRNDGWSKAIQHLHDNELGNHLTASLYKESTSNEKIEIGRDAMGVVFSGGVDNMSFTITIFLSAIISHPEVQSKVHAELDAYLQETSKLHPSPGDERHLPYLKATWMESMRWMPSLPLGIPRSTQQEDVYKEYYIPKETLVFLNVGFMCRDPRIWDEPNRFIPERWLDSDNSRGKKLPDVHEIVFGFGRRVCPGRQLANRMGLFFVSALLSRYDVLPPAGQPVPTPDSFEYEDNFSRYPSNLLCRFCPRTV